MTTHRNLPRMAAVAVLALAPLALVPAARAATAAAPGQDCTGGPSPQDGLYVYIDSADSFIACTAQGGGVFRPAVQPCPPALEYDPGSRLCTFPRDVDSRTTLTAGNARLSPMPLQLTGLTATLKDAGGQPVPLAGVTFRDLTGQLLCTARTNWLGTATCHASDVVGDAEALLAGYTAVFTTPVANLDSTQATGTVSLP